MSEKIRVVCGECEKKLACPASAAGKKVRCTSCGAVIRVPGASASSGSSSKKKRRSSSGAGKSARRPRQPESDYDDPYQDTVPGSSEGLPPRARKGKKPSRKKASRSGGDDRHWSKKILVGFGIMGASIASNAVQLAIMGPPNMRTAEGKGQAFGQGLVTVGGLIFGLVIVVRGFLANKSDE